MSVRRRFGDTRFVFRVDRRGVGVSVRRRSDGQVGKDLPTITRDRFPSTTGHRFSRRVARKDVRNPTVYVDFPESGTRVGFEVDAKKDTARAFDYGTDDLAAWDRYRSATDPVEGCKRRPGRGR